MLQGKKDKEVSKVIKTYAAFLSPHDFFYFASKDYGIGLTEKAIHNTALMYALNRHIPTLQRVVSGNLPHYEEDFGLFQLYSTPAQPLSQIAVVGSKTLPWLNPEGMIRITYNTVDSPIVFCMEGPSLLRKARRGLKEVFPKMGSYLTFPPLSTFTFFVLGGKGSKLIRIGKKMPPARVTYRLVKNLKEKIGRFKASHPINLLDLPPSTKFLSGYLVRMPPSPIAMDAELDGTYLEGTINRKKVRIAKPNVKRFPGVFA